MAERRSLVAGVRELEPSLEKEFVYGTKSRGAAETQTPTAATPTRAAIDRVPFSSRIRTDIAAALKKASLERQLAGVEPNSLQEIVEEALIPWLRSNNYLT